MAKKIILIFIAVIAIAAAGVYFYLKQNRLKDFEPLVRQKLQSLVNDASNGLYALNFDKLDADVVNSKLIITNVRLSPDTAFAAVLDSSGRRPPDIFTVSLKVLSIDGINIDDFLSNKKIDLDILYIEDPSVEINHKKSLRLNNKNDTADIQTVYQRISKQMNRIAIKKIVISNMNVVHHNEKDNNKQSNTGFKNVNFIFENMLIDSLTQFDSTRFLYAKNASIFLGKLQLPTADSLYNINLDSISVNAAAKSLQVKSFSLEPRETKKNFSKQLAFVKDRYDVTLENISFKNIDWWNIVSDESFEAGEAMIEKGVIDIYADRSLPPNPKSKLGNYPSQLIMKAPLPLHIKAIKILNTDVTYSELNAGSGKTGKIIFTGINGAISNITNDSVLIARNPFLNIDAKALLMHAGNMHTIFNFNLAKADEGLFSVDANLEAMDGRAINPATEALGFFKIETLDIHKLSTHIEGTNYTAKASVKFAYDNMKIELLKNDNENGTQRKQGFLSFIANTFVLKQSNDFATVSATYSRDFQKSFFNFIWKTILAGILKATGYEMGADKLK